MAYYDIAQICLNGHVITDSAGSSPEFRQAFCDKCGQKTITHCEACSSPIPGYCHIEGVITFRPMDSGPDYCGECGRPFPWKAAKLDAALAMADEMAGLTDAQRLTLKASVEDIAGTTPRTELAVMRVKKVIGEVPNAVGDTIRKFMVEVASETAKKVLTGK